MRKIKILFLLSNFRPGGAETQYANLIRNIDRKRFEPILGIIEYKNNIASEEFLERFGDTHIEKFQRVRTADLKVVRCIANYAKQHHVDIIQTLLFMDNQIGRFAGLLSRTRVVTSVRGEIGPLLGSTKTRFEFMAQLLSVRVIVNSEWLKGYLIDKGARVNKVVTIYNGIDFDRYECKKSKQDIRREYNISPDQRVVTIVARLHPMKDHVTFLESIVKVRESIPEVIALVVGDGFERECLENYVRDNELDECVRFLGSVEDKLSEIYRISDVLVLSSQWGESFPNVVLEAMSASVPVVASNISAIPEIIDDGVSGYLVEPKSPVAFSRRIVEVLTDADLRNRLVENAQPKSRLFGIPEMVKKYESLYTELAG